MKSVYEALIPFRILGSKHYNFSNNYLPPL